MQFASLLTDYLAQHGLRVTNYQDPFLGLSAGIEKYDLLILDLTLPGIDGLEVCKEVAERYDIPIIISSARSDLNDKVIGLQNGADDYLPKPYDPQEMLARITSLLRRYKKTKNSDDHNTLSKIQLNETSDTVSIEGKVLNLTPAEYAVLRLLIKNRGATVSKEQILYDSDIFEYGSDSSLSVILSRLRKKLGEEVTIKTVRGVGYKLLT